MKMTARDVQQEIINAHAAALRSSADPAQLKAWQRLAGLL
jgi:hypothetical protein